MRYSLKECFRELLGWKFPKLTNLAEIKEEFANPGVASKVSAYLTKYASYIVMDDVYSRPRNALTVAFKQEKPQRYDDVISLEKRFNLLLINAATIGSEAEFLRSFENLLNEVSNFPIKSEYEREYCATSVFNAMQNLYELFVEEDVISCQAKLEFLTRSEFFHKQKKIFLKIVVATIMQGASNQSLQVETAIAYLDKFVLPLIQQEISSTYNSLLLPVIKEKYFTSRERIIEENRWAVQFLQFCSENKRCIPAEWLPSLTALYHHLIDTVIPQNQAKFAKIARIRFGGTYDDFDFGIRWEKWQESSGEMIASTEVISMIIYSLMLNPEENLPQILFKSEVVFGISQYQDHIGQSGFNSFLDRVLDAIEKGAKLTKEQSALLATHLCNNVSLLSYPLTANAALAVVKLLSPHADYIDKAQPLLAHCSKIIFTAYCELRSLPPSSQPSKLEEMLEQVFSIHSAILENDLKQLSKRHADLSEKLVTAIKYRKPVVDGDFSQLAEFNCLQTECKKTYDLLAKYMQLQIYLSIDKTNIFDSDLCFTDPNIKLWAERYVRVLELKAQASTQPAVRSMAQAIIRFSGIHTQPQQASAVVAESVDGFKAHNSYAQ